MPELLPFPVLIIASFCLLQLVFVSWFLSKSWRSSRMGLLQNYPQAKFPHLYVHAEYLEMHRLQVRKRLDYALLTIGGLILVGLLVAQASVQVFGTFMLLMAVIQLIPILVSAYWCKQNSRLMSTQYPQKIRHTELKQTSLTKQVSKTKWVLLTFSHLVTATLALAVFFAQWWDASSYKALLFLGLNLVVLSLIGRLAYRLVHGVRVDHFIENEERHEKLSSELNYLVLANIFYNVFLVLLFIIESLQLENLWVSILVSLFYQSMLFTTREQYYPVNPSVYKAG